MQPFKPLIKPRQQSALTTEATTVPAGIKAEPRAARSDTHVAPGTPAPDAGTV